MHWVSVLIGVTVVRSVTILQECDPIVRTLAIMLMLTESNVIMKTSLPLTHLQYAVPNRESALLFCWTPRYDLGQKDAIISEDMLVATPSSNAETKA